MRKIMLYLLMACSTISSLLLLVGCFDDQEQQQQQQAEGEQQAEGQQETGAEEQGKQADGQAAPNEGQSAQENGEEVTISTAHYLEQEVEKLREVRHATILIRDNDAFGAIELTEKAGATLDEETRHQIVETIRVTDPEIQNIHLSNNTDFHTRLQGLGRDIERGRPMKQIGDVFNQSIRRMFPELVPQ